MIFEVKILPSAHEFIFSLSDKMRAKVHRGIDLLKIFGYRLGMPHAKTLEDTGGLKELRIKVATDICRLFYFHYKDQIYVATSGYIKRQTRPMNRKFRERLESETNFCRSMDYEDENL